MSISVLFCQKSGFSVRSILLHRTRMHCSPCKPILLIYTDRDDRITDFLNVLFSQYENEPDCGNKVLYNYAVAESIKNYSYGQCWSTKKDSDALWRIYNYGNHAIQIESNQKAIEEFIDFNEEFETVVEKVKYDVTETKRRMAFADYYLRGMPFYESFFHKRKAFKHENEVRVLFLKSNARSAFQNRLNRYRKQLVAVCNDRSLINSGMLADVIRKVHQELPDSGNPSKEYQLNIIDLNRYIRCVRVHPLAEDWYVELIKTLCNKSNLKFGGKSNLYEEP